VIDQALLRGPDIGVPVTGAPAVGDISEAVEPALCFDYVWRFWGTGASRWAVLRDVTLDFDPGTVNWIGGRNGAGKTTLLRLAAGILAPNQGLVTFEGMAPHRHWREYHRQLGFLSAGDRGLYARLSVKRHLEYWASVAFVPHNERRSTVDAALASFGLEELTGRRVDRLSQGQRQRVRLAMTFLHNPRLVLLDEPRNSLDDEGMAVLVRGVREVTARGGTVLWCSPSGEDQPLGFDHRYLLQDGQLELA
jgi:ABC-2 type transport system ATP-binding protein